MIDLPHSLASIINMCGIALSLSGVHIEGHLEADTADLEIDEQQEGPSNADLSEGLKRRGPDSVNKETVHVTSSIQIDFIGSLLSLRGDRPVSQPVKDNAGNILVYNGEIFGGLQVEDGENDTVRLMEALGTCCARACHGTLGDEICACKGEVTVQSVLSALRGPWALVYWQAENQVLWFGRDVLGRRSLLTRRPSRADPRFLLSSVAPEGAHNWEELQCGIYSLSCNTGLTQLHKWEDPLLRKLVTWDRQHFDPDILPLVTNQQATIVDAVLNVLRRSVKKRTCNIRKRHQEENDAYTPVAVLFSGGLDSMILAALLDECLPPENGIDLLNVSFEGSTAPDRVSAIAGLAELERVSPSRRQAFYTRTCQNIHYFA